MLVSIMVDMAMLALDGCGNVSVQLVHMAMLASQYVFMAMLVFMVILIVVMMMNDQTTVNQLNEMIEYRN